MVSIGALWLAILLSTIAVWAASAINWMVMPHHKSDYGKLPDEDAARQALTSQLAPGQYSFPHAPSMKDSRDPEIVRKFEEGPVGFLTVVPSGAPTMGSKIILSLAFYLTCCCLFVASRTVCVRTHSRSLLAVRAER